MNKYEFISIIISVIAVMISLYTLLPRRSLQVYMSSRIVYTQIPPLLAIVIRFEISNTGNRPISIDDILLSIKYKNKGINNTYTFTPIFMIENFDPIKSIDTSIQTFNSILAPSNNRFVRDVIFIPSDENFTPSHGEMEIQSLYRVSNQSQWKKALGINRFTVSDEDADNWKDEKAQRYISANLIIQEYREKLSQ